MSARIHNPHAVSVVTDESQSVASRFEEVMWWQTLAINHLHVVGLSLSNVMVDDVASVSVVREHSRALLRQVIADIEQALHLLDTELPEGTAGASGEDATPGVSPRS